MSFELSREQYTSLYGPTTGDAIRLADTELFAQIEQDLTTPGEEAVFGGGKVVRDGMGQNGQLVRDVGIPDTVICLLYTSPSPRDRTRSRMPSSA